MNSPSDVPLKRLAICRDDLRRPVNATERASMQGDIPYWGANSIQDYVDRALVSGPTVLVGEDGAPFFDRTKDVAFFLDEPVWPNNHIHVIKARQGVSPRWLTYALNSVDFSRWISGSTRDKLTQSDLMQIALPVTEPSDQSAIADFLDDEAAQIDAMIEAQRGLVAALDERRAAVVLGATVSRWMNESPVRLSRLLAKLDRPPQGEGGVVTAYRDGEVTLRSKRRDDGYTFSETESRYQGVAPGDVVFHALDGFAGAVGVSDSYGKCSPVYHVCRATAGNDATFISHLLRALGLSGFLTAYAWSVRQRSVDYRNWSLFGAIPVRVPTLDEQRRAVEEIGDSLTRIDTMMTATVEAIALMQERRSALISAAVTGRIDPRTGKETTTEKVLE